MRGQSSVLVFAGLWLGGLLTAAALMAAAVADWPGGAAARLASAVVVASWVAAGAVAALFRAALPFGLLLMGGGLFLAVSGFLTALAEALAMAGSSAAAAWTGWVGAWIFFPHLAAMCLIYLLFPGSVPLEWWSRGVALLACASTSLAMVGTALNPGPLALTGPLESIVNPVAGGGWAGSLTQIGVVGIVLSMSLSVLALFMRIRTLDSALRPGALVVAWLGVGNIVVGGLAAFPPGPWVYLITVPATVLLIGAVAAAAVLGPLWDIRATAGRILLYLTLSAFTGLFFIAAVAVSAPIFGNGVMGFSLAALLVCIGFAPAQQLLRERIRRLLYGRGAQPYQVMTDLGQAMEAAGAPAEALQRLCELAKEALRVPSVAIDVAGAESAIHSGTQTGRELQLPLTHQGEFQGVLRVGHRSGEELFSPTDMRLIADLARQAGAAAHSLALMGALRQTSLELATARDEERRRMRRDLHDGVASRITAVGLTIDVAASMLPGDAGRSLQLLSKARKDLSDSLTEVSRIISGLGPADIENLGLAEALHALAARFSESSFSVSASTVPGIDRVPHDIAAAAYWIAAEAMHNAARHAHAANGTLTVWLEHETLHLRFIDDGIGTLPAPGSGTGIAGMRARAASCGGDFTIAEASPGGTEIRIAFPGAVVHA